MNSKKVIIIGGGFGGINATKKLKKSPVEILLIDKANYHLFQPLLYQVATAALLPGDIASLIREVLAKQPNATVSLADIITINKANKTVAAANGKTFAYDCLIIASGATHSYFGHPEWEESAPGLKTLSDALIIPEKILLSYERAERCTDAGEAEKFIRFVIIGGGPTGVEMAGSIAEMAHKSLPGIASVAIQHGCYVARLIHQQVPTQERKPFVYFDKGMIATIGRAKAVAIIGKLKISGYLAWLAWSLIHVVYLISFASRFLIMTQWIFLYFFNERRIRLITRPVTKKGPPYL